MPWPFAMGPIFIPGSWNMLTTGQRIPVVFTVICRDVEAGKHLAFSCDRPGHRFWINGVLPEGRVLSGIGLEVTSLSPTTLSMGEKAWVHALPDCDFHSSSSVIEVCSGLGGFSKEAARLGLKVLCGVDWNKAWSPLFSALHDGASLVVGDLV